MALFTDSSRTATAATPARAAGGGATERRQGMMYDMTRCIGCQACTVACKEWNDLPVTIHDAEMKGPSFQSLEDLTPSDWTLMRFTEASWDDAPGGMLLRMRKDACHHCGNAPCAQVCPVSAISQMPNGAVVIDQDLCIGCGYCTSGCPFNIPRLDSATHKASKCTLCYDRTSNGLEPACAKACPTDAISFGYLDELHQEAERRVANYNARRPAGTPEAYVYDAPDLEGLGVFYVLNAPVTAYDGRHTLPERPAMNLAISTWKRGFKPLGWIGILGATVLAAAHFRMIGAKRLSDPATLPTPMEPGYKEPEEGSNG